MEYIEQNKLLINTKTDYLQEQVSIIQSMLSYALNLPQRDIKISFPELNNFYFVNNVFKSSWAIYIINEKLPKLLFTGNFIIQGEKYGDRSLRSPFGAKALSPLTSIANTFSTEASFFKQIWALDLNLLNEDENRLRLSVKEYQEFLKLLNFVRARWLLHLSEEGSYDFVIGEFSEPSDSVFFIDLEQVDSMATKVKTYFKPISQKALDLFKTLSTSTEFEGRFLNLQPGMWLRDDVLIELEKYYSDKFFNGEKLEPILESEEQIFNNPFRVQALKPTY